MQSQINLEFLKQLYADDFLFGFGVIPRTHLVYI